MRYLGMLRGSVAVAAMLSASAAHADLTADEVWQAWQAYAASAGQTIAADSEAQVGDTLTISALTVSSEVDDVTFSATIDEIVFTEQDDGRVAITMSDTYPLTILSEDGEGVVIGISMPGMNLLASETETGLNYALRAPEIEFAVEEVLGEEGPELLEASLRAAGVIGNYEVPTDLGGPISTELEAAALNAMLRVIDTEMETDIDVTYSASAPRVAFRGNGLNLMEDGDPAAAIRDGFSIELALGFDTMRFDFMVEEGGSLTETSGGSDNGDSRFVMNAQELSLSNSSRNGELVLSGDEIPLPQINMKVAETTFGFILPVSASSDPQDFSFTTRLVEANVSEGLWDALDPTARLPRNPATVVIELAGQAVLANDLFSEQTAMGMMMAGPEAVGELVSLNLGELLVRFAGAELSGDGAFTFDNDDYDTFPGMPRPSGVLELALRGGNTLLDTLVDMGLVPAEDAMGARMMMALFTRPGDSEDELLTTLEVREDGAVLANDQRIQ